MSTLNQIREGLSRAWDTIAEGWRELREGAAEALTRFHPGSEPEAEAGQPPLRTARWGLLAAEVSEEDQHVVVRLEAPGMKAEDFDIEVVGEVLVVRGEKRHAWEGERGQFHVTERAYGRFERAVRLPAAVNEEGARARYDAGVLTIRLPKVHATRRSRIPIETG
jgi:HSP20 family protein